MVRGLRSSFLQMKPDEDKVLPRQDIAENKGDNMKQTVFDLNDEPSVSSLKEVELEKKEEIAECREDGEVGNLKVGELNEDDRSRGMVEDNEDNKEDDSAKKKVKEEGLEGKVQFSGRVLRSRFAVKNGSMNEGDKVESEVDKTEDSNSSEKKTIEVVKEENDQSHSEVKEAQRKGGKMEKRKRGRPPKFQGKNGFEKKTLELQVRENDNPDGDVKKEFKRKRGRPPKVLGNGGLDKKAFKIQAGESDRLDSDVSKESKRKRGRPRKVEGNSGFEETKIKLVAGESDQSDGGGNKKSKHKRGRPMKGQRNQGVEKKADGVKAGESYHSDVETGKEANYKHEILPRMHGNDGVEMKAVETEMGEVDHFDCELSKKVKRKRGRPPKVQDNDGLVNKRVELKREGSDQHNSKAREVVIRKRGRPAKLQVVSKALKGRLAEGRKKLGGLRRGRKKLRGSLKFNIPANSSYSKRRLIGEECNVTRFVSANKIRYDDMEKNDSKASLMPRPKVVTVEGDEKRVKKAGDEVEQRRSEAKRAVRDRIVNLLKAAGWTIDYRPRNSISRQYNDAVYVNPEGRTHWSVTLAYRRLKGYYESGDCDSKVSPNGFIFTPIPEEELSILTRVVRKKRKNKPKGGDSDTVDDGEVEKKVNKRKKKQKGNENVKKKKKQKLLKEKLLLHEEDISDGTFQRRIQGSSRKLKLQETQKRKRYALLVRNALDGAEYDNDGYVLYDGKRTVLSWMIDVGTVPQDGKVEYLIQRRTRTRESKSGRITRDGIQCNCCSDVFTVAEFETHAGSKLQQPFQNIYLETGIPLLQCLLDAWNKQQLSECKGFHFVDFCGEDPNDDTCGICGDGGDLICCDSCPSTFHQSCLDIKAFPSGNWNCVYCTCKYCGIVGNTYQRGKYEDTDPTVLRCHLCEEKYHEPCIQPMDAFDDDSSSAFFCGKRCKELFERLKMLVGVKHELPEGFSWTLIQRFDINSDVSLSEAYQKVESNAKLAVALSVMDECFLPLVDHRSGINLIHNIVYNIWSNFTRLNYSGFFTAILERGDEIISAASIRIHGNQLAEMPFIGTRYAFRRQGMCRRLLCAIESALSSLNVQKLVIPAVSELRETWTSVFGFQPLEAESKQRMRNMNMLVFPGVDMLQKPLLTHVMEEQMVGEKSYKSGEKHSVGFDLNVSAESPAPQTDEKNDEHAAVESAKLLPDDTLKYTSNIMAETVNPPESVTVSSSCVPAPEERKLESDSQKVSSVDKIDESIVKQNHGSKREGSIKCSDDNVHADNEVAVLVNVSKVGGKDVVANGFDGIIQVSEDTNDIKHQENSKLQTVECVSDFEKSVKNCHAIPKEAANQTSLSALQSATQDAKGHSDTATFDSKNSPSQQGSKVGASGEVLAPIDVNFHTYEVCNDTSKKKTCSYACTCPRKLSQLVLKLP